MSSFSASRCARGAPPAFSSTVSSSGHFQPSSALVSIRLPARRRSMAAISYVFSGTRFSVAQYQGSMGAVAAGHLHGIHAVGPEAESPEEAGGRHLRVGLAVLATVFDLDHVVGGERTLELGGRTARRSDRGDVIARHPLIEGEGALSLGTGQEVLGGDVGRLPDDGSPQVGRALFRSHVREVAPRGRRRGGLPRRHAGRQDRCDQPRPSKRSPHSAASSLHHDARGALPWAGLRL